MNSNQPPIRGVIRSDYLGQIAVLFPVVFWAMYLIVDVFGFFPSLRPGRTPMTAESAPFLLCLAAGATVIGIPLMILRLNWFRSLFAGGEQVDGKVIRVWFYRGRGRVEFSYEYQGREHTVSRALAANKRTRMLKAGDAVRIIADPAKPRRAVICDLYQ